MLKKRIAPMLVTACVFGALISTNAAAYVLNTKGGDCKQIGTWDSGTKTCKLNRNVSYTESNTIVDMNNVIIQIAGRGITLDGAGFSVIGSGTNSEMGIYVSGQRGVVIKNLTMTGTCYGVELTGHSTNNTIANITVNNSLYGVSIDNESNGNAVIGSTFTGLNYGVMTGNYVQNNRIDSSTFIKNNYGIMLFGSASDNNQLTNSTFSENLNGVYIGLDSKGNTLTGNTFQYNAVGVTTQGGVNNTIYRNNFIGHTDEAGKPSESLALVEIPNSFSQALPLGGNYWSYYDSEAEGCTDMNNDNICDQPYALPGNIDNLPWTTMNGWLE